MENYVETPPVWSRYDSTSNLMMSNFCSMDWTNVGPVVNTYEASRCTGTTSKAQAHASSSESVFCRNKDISRKFPLEKLLEFMYPVNKPKYFYLYSNSKPSNYYLWSWGNCLETLDIYGKTYLLYPSYSKQKTEIGVSEIKAACTSKCCEEKCGGILCALDTVSTLTSRRSFQMKRIIAKEINGEGYVVARSKSIVMVYVLDESLAVKSKYAVPFGSDILLTDVAMCETIPGCFAVVTADGDLSLHEHPNGHLVWKCQIKEDSKSKNLYQCEFGKHVIPSLLVNSKSAVWSCDTRCKYNSLTSSSGQTILTLKDMEYYIPTTDIILSVARSGWSQLYVVTSNCVVLTDERYCKTPVMKWHHMMQELPSFSSVTRLKDREVLMLGSSENSKVCAISHEWSNQKNSQCFSGMPKHFDIVLDTAEFAYQQGMWFRHHMDRLDNPLSGFAAYSHPGKNNMLHLFTLNVAGDIFVQVFRKGNPDVDDCAECYNTKDNSQYGKEVLKEWEETVIEEMMKNHVVKEATSFDLIRFYNSLERSIKVKGRNLYSEGGFWNVKQYVINKCLGSAETSLMSIEDNSMRMPDTGISLDKFVPDHLLRGVETALKNGCTDELSNKMLSLWKSKAMEKSFGYKRAPFRVDCLLQFPKKLKRDQISSMDTLSFDENTMDSFCHSDAETDISISSSWSRDYLSDSVFRFPATVPKKRKKTQMNNKIDGF